jgi:ABC-type transport system involved in multi-copper enzyme maturation permease subunit
MAHKYLQAIFNSFINYNSSFIISLIPEAPNRQAVFLIVFVGIPIVEVEVPSVVIIVLRTTPIGRRKSN